MVKLTQRVRGLVGILALGTGLTVLTACEAPPPESGQIGFRGTSMMTLDNPRVLEDRKAKNVAPAPSSPLVPVPGGAKASTAYQNLQVLGDLELTQFIRLMTAITEWVSPEQGCAYCHAGANFASDDLYTKIVSRRMLQMTIHINQNWQDHVGATGVTCYTCHRGKPAPDNIWFKEDGIPQASGLSASRQGQNLAMPVVAHASLPYDPLSRFLTNTDDLIKVQGGGPLPIDVPAVGTKDAEDTYALMMYVSDSLGVNCTYCHNSRAFGNWEQSPPARTTAWHGIRMVRDLNDAYLIPLGPQYPPKRIGPAGDAPKASCGTCHNGLPKPLNGASMIGDYPSLKGHGG